MVVSTALTSYSTNDMISVHNFNLSCHLGVLPEEREKTQRVGVALDFYLAKKVTLESETEGFVDYVRALGDISFLLKHSRFFTIETAAVILARHLLGPGFNPLSNVKVAAVRVSLEKSQALDGHASSSITIIRDKSDFAYGWRDLEKVRTLSLCAKNDLRISLVEIFPATSVTVHYTEPEKQSDLVLSSGVLVDKKILEAGDGLFATHPGKRTYENQSDRLAYILCIERHPDQTVEERFATEARVSDTTGATKTNVYPTKVGRYITDSSGFNE